MTFSKMQYKLFDLNHVEIQHTKQYFCFSLAWVLNFIMYRKIVYIFIDMLFSWWKFQVY